MKKLNDYYYELNGHKIPSLMVNLYQYGGLNLKPDDFRVGEINPLRGTPTFGVEDKTVKYDRQLDPLAMNQYGYGLMGAYLGTQTLLNKSNDKHYQEYKNRWIRDYSMPSLLQDPNKFSSDMYESPIYEKGGLSREQDYGSKSHPYPSVSSVDFAGPHRSYPIPTEADARDALRLAHLHGASGVISKVLAKYPQLRKKLGGVINDYMQTGGVFTSQQEINDANAAARGIATRKGLIPGENSYVARRIGDPKPTISVSGPNVPMKALPYTVPNYITRDDIQTYQGRAWYNDPQTGNVVDVDLSVLNQPRFRKTPEEQAQDLAARNAAPPMAYGGIHINPANKGKFTATKKRTGKTTEELTHSKNPTTRKRAIFAQNFGHRFGGLIEGEEHDLSPEQIKRYESLGYEFDYL